MVVPDFSKLRVFVQSHCQVQRSLSPSATTHVGHVPVGPLSLPLPPFLPCSSSSKILSSSRSCCSTSSCACTAAYPAAPEAPSLLLYFCSSVSCTRVSRRSCSNFSYLRRHRSRIIYVGVLPRVGTLPHPCALMIGKLQALSRCNARVR